MTKEKKTARLEVMMTPTEKKKLEQLAFKADIPASQVVRTLIREAIQKVS